LRPEPPPGWNEIHIENLIFSRVPVCFTLREKAKKRGKAKMADCPKCEKLEKSEKSESDLPVATKKRGKGRKAKN